MIQCGGGRGEGCPPHEGFGEMARSGLEATLWGGGVDTELSGRVDRREEVPLPSAAELHRGNEGL